MLCRFSFPKMALLASKMPGLQAQLFRLLSQDIGKFEERHSIYFSEYFADELKQLQALAEDGLVTISSTHLKATSRGRLLLRIIAACFDAYLNPTATILQFSKTI